MAKLLDVVLVVTQVVDENDDEIYVQLVQHISADRLPVLQRRVFPVLAEPMKDGEELAPVHGVDDLVAATLTALPSSVRRAFLNSLRATEKVLQLKEAEAHRVVLAASAAAAATGAVAIPFSDAFVLVPIQVAMLARINSVMGLNLDQSKIEELLQRALAAGATTALGKWLVAQAAKFVPLAGNPINAAIAAGVTAALGEAYIYMCRAILTARAEGRTMPMEEAVEIFISQMELRFRERLSGQGA